jgi:hypothetical protein
MQATLKEPVQVLTKRVYLPCVSDSIITQDETVSKNVSLIRAKSKKVERTLKKTFQNRNKVANTELKENLRLLNVKYKEDCEVLRQQVKLVRADQKRIFDETLAAGLQIADDAKKATGAIPMETYVDLAKTSPICQLAVSQDMKNGAIDASLEMIQLLVEIFPDKTVTNVQVVHVAPDSKGFRGVVDTDAERAILACDVPALVYAGGLNVLLKPCHFFNIKSGTRKFGLRNPKGGLNIHGEKYDTSDGWTIVVVTF